MYAKCIPHFNKLLHTFCIQNLAAIVGHDHKYQTQSLTKVKYTLSILQIYWKYTSKVYLKYTSSILQPVELQKKKCTSSLCYFNKRSTFEAHFVKLNQYFNVNLKYISSILYVYLKCTF